MLQLLKRKRFLVGSLLLLLGGVFGAQCWLTHAQHAQAQEVPDAVLALEKKRVEVIQKLQPTVVALFAAGGNNGGSGVVIDDQGYVLTNFHVVEATGPVMKCGVNKDLYEGVLVGLDKVGDVALVKLLPKKAGDKFAFAPLGDSDKVRAGDWSIAAGNPFLLATDFTPTVTFGLISGVNRYQYPAGTFLEYTDCIQIDTSINPGNSGGPLYNLDGEVIGINGRGSFEKRGRVNSGVGYAISINQIKNFMGQLRAGLDTDHATLGAAVSSDEEEGAIGKITIANLLEECDAYRRGLALGDEVLRFGGRSVTTVNQYKNILGIYPKGWRIPIAYRHTEEKEKRLIVSDKEVLVRLMGVQKQEIKDPKNPTPDGPKPPVKPQPLPKTPATNLYEAKPGYANFYYNRKLRDQLLRDFNEKTGDFKKHRGKWTLEGEAIFGDVLAAGKSTSFKIEIEETEAAKADVKLIQGGDITFSLNPFEINNTVAKLQSPQGSGGLLLALYHYRELLSAPDLEKTFNNDFSHGGSEPFYLPAPDAQKPDFTKLRLEADVLRTRMAGTPIKWFFSQKDRTLAGFELTVVEREDDPCEVYLADYKDIGAGRQMPHRIEVRYGNARYAALTVKKIELGMSK